MKKCTKCLESKESSEFNKNAAKKDGLQTFCRPCGHQSFSEYYRKNKKRHIGYVQKRKAGWMEKLVEYLTENPCVDCGQDDVRTLEFDHVKGEKTTEVTRLARGGASWENIQKEINKCVVRCANCHKIRTAEPGWLRSRVQASRDAGGS